MSSPIKQPLNESNSNDNDSNDDSNFKNKRLVIHKLSLINFKSFAGKQIIGPFHKSFSAIVGPNGSGKSNTIDALLFVFGYRASKMRQSKLSELIHNSAEHPNCDHCAVEVHFRDIVDTPGSEEYEVVPNSDLVVTRMAMRNNQSKYLINDETSNYNEVTHLLRDRGIDLDHNRFLILQGEVEQIAQMKSKAPSPHEDGLLEYLEDIIGTAKYKQSIEDSLIEMDKLSDERSERLGRLRIVEKEKDRLEGYKGEAEGYLKDVNVVVRKKNKLYQRYLFDLNENIQICIEQSQQLTSDLQSKESKIKGRRQLINDLESSYNNLDKDVKKVENEMKKVSKSHEDKNKENVKLDVKIKDLNSKIKKLNKVIQDDKHSQSEAEHSLASLSEDIEKARKELDEHESGLGSEEEKLESIIDSLKGKTQQFTDQIEVKQKELQPWQAKISDKQTKIDVAQSERQLLTDKSRSAQNAVIDAEKSLEDLLNEVQIKKNSVEEINDKRNNISDQMKESEISLKDMRNKEIYARNDLASARQKADEAKASLTANRSQDAVLATLNRLRDTGRVSGFHGRLGNLGVIDDKYDVAITTACGALNNFVVDTVNAAQTCIKHLRENNVGRASFIVLEQLPKRDVGKIQTPENVPRLIDLVKVKKNNFIPAFFKALGNTLVAKDLAQGNRIAYGKQRWRVVTLQGNVIDTSGTMSGGGQRVLKGGMGSTFSNSSNEVVTIDQVHQLQSEADRLEENLHEINEKVQKIEIEYRNFEKIIPELDIEIEKAEIDQSTFKKRISESKKYVEKMKVESKPNKSDLNRIKDLDNLIESLTEEINDLKSKTEKIESEITGLQDKILEVGGVKLRAQKSKVDGIKTMMSIANETITKNEVSLTKAQKDFEKYKKSIKNNQSKLEEIENDLNEINKKNENQISKANNVKNEVESLRKTYESKVDELSELKQQLDSEASEMQSFNNFESDIKSKIEEINNMHRDSEHKVQIYNERLTKLELQDVEEEKEEENDKEKEGGDVKMDEEADVMEPIKGQSLELERYSNDDLANIETDKLKKEILRCEEKIDKSSVNLEVLNEYKKRKEEYKNRADDVQHVTKQRDEAKDKYDELRKKRLDEFMHGFTIISSKLKEMYQMITLGGNAELELVDSLDPFSEGIIFSVMPPKKSWKNISNLSGGEKTLSSLALVFALHAFKPTPLYFMDEIDAALDFRNVSIVANYIRDRTKDAQFIIISLRNDMFELSNRLVGIYKTMNATKVRLETQKIT